MTFENSNSAQIDLTMDVPYLFFPVLSELPFLRHGFSTRLGGVSSGIFSSMNLGHDSGPYIDDLDKVEENYRRIANSIGVDSKSIVISKQVHKTNIRLVDENDCGKGLYRPRDYDEIDGLITNLPNITLVTKYADCVPLFFVDPQNKSIGLTHSGWRGTVKKIGKITVEEMQKHFGSNPSDIIAVIGPSICTDCYEVGEEVATEFKDAFPSDCFEHILITKGNGKYQCNLWAANQSVLSEAGLRPENIHISGVCTSCNSDLLFSHRKTEGKRGSLAAFLALTNI
ncbi:MAG: peptidoglycan editing factor PgeF [Mobilitalea sp.]